MPAALKWIIALILAKWLEVPGPMRALLILMSMDYMGGLMVAGIAGTLCARIGWMGLVRKAATLMIVLATSIAQRAAGKEWGIDNILILGFVANEFLSVVRNCAALGAPLPPEVLQRVEAVRSLLRPGRSKK